MKVGWLADAGNEDGTLGGAELTQAEFRAAAPEGVEVVDCPANDVNPDLDLFVLHNIVGYRLDELLFLDGPVFKYHHDVGPHLTPKVRVWLHETAKHICASPVQRAYMKLDAELVPPALNLGPFRKAAESAGERSGAVAIGPWMNPAKAPDEAAKWAAGNGGIDFYGEGPFAPLGSVAVSYEEMPEVLARYKTFVHLPREVEPFGRSTVEAWASGCEIVVNRLVGARHWIKEEPDKLESAAEDFWRLVLET